MIIFGEDYAAIKLKAEQTLAGIISQNGPKTDLWGCFCCVGRWWMFQHGVLRRLPWPLLLYKVSMTTVEEMVGTITQLLLHESVKISE